ncbi:hypothetical protein [Aminobacterium mobile]|uniref:hypothetical protein n=1 Tax=Aminobacterium mobile TaxID=81467 RepID=UPI0004658A29|nr:hypothetical protein [Aminobacterium mobile]
MKKNIYICLFLFFFLGGVLFSGGAEAEVEKYESDIKSGLKLDEMVRNNVEQFWEDAQNPYDYMFFGPTQKNGGQNAWRPDHANIGSLSGGRWPVLRTIIFGAENIQECIEFVSSAEFAGIFKHYQIQTKKMIERSNMTGTDDALSGTDVVMVGARVEAEKSSQEEISRKFNNFKKMGDGLAKIAEISGVFSGKDGKTLAKIAQNIGLILLFYFATVRILWWGTQNMISEIKNNFVNSEMILVPVQIAFKAAILGLFIVHFADILIFCVQIVDSITKIITQATGGDSVFVHASALVDAKVAMLPATWTSQWSSIVCRTVLQICVSATYIFTQIALIILIILADIGLGLLAILAPVVLAFSILPSFENTPSTILKKLFEFLFYVPVANVYCLILIVLLYASMDSGLLTFIIIGAAYILGAFALPSVISSLLSATSDGFSAGMTQIGSRISSSLVTTAGVTRGFVRHVVGKNTSKKGVGVAVLQQSVVGGDPIAPTQK